MSRSRPGPAVVRTAPGSFVRLDTVQSSGLDAAARESLRALWAAAFGGRFGDEDADHAYGGVHVIAYEGVTPVGHASVVPRRVRFGQDWMEIGYVEAVATAPEHQGAGVGTAVMESLHGRIRARWPVAMLSTGRATGFYERLGWERWRGVSYTLTEEGSVPDDEHGGLLILRLERDVVPDLTLEVTCEDRCGDAW